jgi:hypothetical protein
MESFLKTMLLIPQLLETQTKPAEVNDADLESTAPGRAH